MRIKDLATRATKLLTGNAWFVVDNGTKVEKAAYSEVVKQGIEEYTGSTLAGSTQTVKSAIDALNNKNYTDQASGNSLLDFVATLDKGTYNFRLDNAPEAPVTGGITYTVIKTHTVGDTRCSMIATAMYSSDPDVYSAFVGQNATSITWNKVAKQSDVDVLNSKSIHITGNLSTFSIPVPSKQPSAYHTVMIYGITGSNANDAFMYLVFINVDAQNQVIVIPIKAHGSITITGAWDASTKVLTLTSSAVIYGGLWALT